MEREAGEEEVEDGSLNEDNRVEKRGADSVDHGGRIGSKDEHLVIQTLLPIDLRSNKSDSSKTDTGVVEDTPPHCSIEVFFGHSITNLLQYILRFLVKIRPFFQSRKNSDQESIQSRSETVSERDEVFLVHFQQTWLHIDSCMTKKRKEAV